MQELHNDLVEEGGMEKCIFSNLLDTSVKWAEYCLRNNDGKALEHGLNISRCLAEYHYEIKS